MAIEPRRSPQQRRRLADELAELGLVLEEASREVALEEIDYALRPTVHEGRIPSYGALVEPVHPPVRWDDVTELQIAHRSIAGHAPQDARRYADGLVSWLVRRSDSDDEWVTFDRPAGSERDLVVIADAVGGMVVQRHPNGVVRVAHDHGVFRYNGMGWRYEPPLQSWIDLVHTSPDVGERHILEAMLEFAVHDLGARGIGAILVYGPSEGAIALTDAAEVEKVAPPPLHIDRPLDLAPLRHALHQVDGAALFDRDGTLQHLGVRLVPTPDAEIAVTRTRGMRHTAAQGFSHDDPDATVIVVSDDGPVTVLRAGDVLGSSAGGGSL